MCHQQHARRQEEAADALHQQSEQPHLLLEARRDTGASVNPLFQERVQTEDATAQKYHQLITNSLAEVGICLLAPTKLFSCVRLQTRFTSGRWKGKYFDGLDPHENWAYPTYTVHSLSDLASKMICFMWRLERPMDRSSFGICDR